jgi:hypothetical protein
MAAPDQLDNSLEALSNLLYLIRHSLDDSAKAATYLDVADRVLIDIAASTHSAGPGRPAEIISEAQRAGPLLAYLPHHSWTMECHEYIRLRQHYEAALRHWGHVALSPGAESNSARALLAAEVKQKALEERNAANDRSVFTSGLARSVVPS